MIDKVYKKLKSYAVFSSSYEQFEGLFFQNLDKDKKDKAIKLLLQAIYKMLKSDGERFNEIVESLDEVSKQRLTQWLEANYKQKVKHV